MRGRQQRLDPRALILALIAAAIAAFALVYIGTKNAPESTAGGGIAIGGPFALADQNGRAVSDADFRGSLMLVYFGYSFCPDVCPLALTTMGSAIDKLGDKGRDVVPIFITVDPERDTVAKLKEYAARFHPRLVALTGTPDSIAAAAKAYRVYSAKHEEPGSPYSMDHSSVIYLMGRDGKYLAHFDQSMSADAMAAEIGKIL
jgi:protein SCO1/2